MDFDDIKLRMERVYSAFDQRMEAFSSEKVVVEHVVTETEEGTKISFGGNDIHTFNKVMYIIEHFAKLLDHLKKELKRRGKDPKIIETAIENSLFLKIVIDLNHHEKHGDHSRQQKSNKSPEIKNLRNILRLVAKNPDEGRFRFNPWTGETWADGKGQTFIIEADIIDKEGNIICYLSDLIKESMESLEKIYKEI